MNTNTIGAHSYNIGVYGQNVKSSNNNATATETSSPKQAQPAAETPLKYTVSAENLARYREQFDIATILINVRSDDKLVAFEATRDAARFFADLRDNGYLSSEDATIAL